LAKKLDVKIFLELYNVPRLEIQAGNIRLAMISEATPPDPSDYFYAKGKPLFRRRPSRPFVMQVPT
jgi:hypothetical protein